MLMVNPDRRATVEDIANHWWVNWGWKNSVCDCDAQRDLGGSPMLARLIDWQNRAEKPTVPVPAAVPATAPAPPPTALLLLRQRPKKSKKENVEDGDVDGDEDGGTPGPEDKPGLKRPKGILKTRLTGEPRTPSPEQTEQGPAQLLMRPSDGGRGGGGGGGEEDGSAVDREEEGEEGPENVSGGSPAKMAAPTLPKKGILKNNQQQRESGYYSSPERSESSELLGGAAMSLLASSPPKRAMGRKGILKRNGKYSTFSGPPSSSAAATAVAVAAAAALGEAGTAAESGLSRSQSRPSSIVGEDSSALSLSPGALGVAEWPPTAAASRLRPPNIRACVSAENLLQLANFTGFQATMGPGSKG
ncbi:hypothetical protein CRUP_024407, partial [Coryphaenoides rupestris]